LIVIVDPCSFSTSSTLIVVSFLQFRSDKNIYNIHKLNRIILYKNIFKPIADFLIALLLLAILSPLILVTMILLAIANKGNIFFLQLRPGLHNKSFLIIKFKTMRDAYYSNGDPLPDEERLTKIGQFVRSASLDELLQLINVVKGDMSLVGPRPLLMQYLSSEKCFLEVLLLQRFQELKLQ
jgi:lipopolysaccharide/colanic/teichoic acid biosynthesis glycosyltransferase